MAPDDQLFYFSVVTLHYITRMATFMSSSSWDTMGGSEVESLEQKSLERKKAIDSNPVKVLWGVTFENVWSSSRWPACWRGRGCLGIIWEFWKETFIGTYTWDLRFPSREGMVQVVTSLCDFLVWECSLGRDVYPLWLWKQGLGLWGISWHCCFLDEYEKTPDFSKL